MSPTSRNRNDSIIMSRGVVRLSTSTSAQTVSATRSIRPMARTMARLARAAEAWRGRTLAASV